MTHEFVFTPGTTEEAHKATQALVEKLDAIHAHGGYDARAVKEAIAEAVAHGMDNNAHLKGANGESLSLRQYNEKLFTEGHAELRGQVNKDYVDAIREGHSGALSAQAAPSAPAPATDSNALPPGLAAAQAALEAQQNKIAAMQAASPKSGKSEAQELFENAEKLFRDQTRVEANYVQADHAMKGDITRQQYSDWQKVRDAEEKAGHATAYDAHKTELNTMAERMKIETRLRDFDLDTAEFSMEMANIAKREGITGKAVNDIQKKAEAVDRDHNGTISRAEALQFAHDVDALKPEERKTANVLAHLSSGPVTEKPAPVPDPENANYYVTKTMEKVAALDTDKNGKLSPAEMKAFEQQLEANNHQTSAEFFRNMPSPSSTPGGGVSRQQQR